MAKRFRKFIDEKGEEHYTRIFLSSKESSDKEHAKSHEGIEEAKGPWGDKPPSSKIARGYQALASRDEMGVIFKDKEGNEKDVFPSMKKSHILNVDHYMKERGGELNQDEHRAINHYTEEGHKGVNRALFSNGAFASHDDEHADEHLSNAIKKRTMPRNMTLYSGMRSPEKLPTSKGHHLLHNPAYTSTSTAPEMALPFGGRKNHDGSKTEHTYHQYNHEQYDPKKHKDYKEVDVGDQNMRQVKHKSDPSKGAFIGYSHITAIHVPQGSHAIYPGGLSLNSREQEVILHKNARVAIHPVPTVDHGTRTVLWKGKLVHDGIKPTRHAQALGLKIAKPDNSTGKKRVPKAVKDYLKKNPVKKSTKDLEVPFPSGGSANK